MSPPRRPGTPGSPVLPLLGAAGVGSGPGGRRGVLPYALLLLAGFLLVNLFSSSSGAARGSGSSGGGGNGPLGGSGGWGNGSSSNASADGLLSLGLQLEQPSSERCDCSGKFTDATGIYILSPRLALNTRAATSHTIHPTGRDNALAPAASGRAQPRSKGLRGQGAADDDGEKDGDGQPPPWLGAGRPPAAPRKRHVRVVIRVHHLQEEATRSLIWALRGQTQPKAEKDRFSVDFALVATERKGLPVVRRIARGTVEAGFNCLA